MKTKRTGGLVLVELLVYIMVAILLIMAIGYFIISSYFLYSDTIARSQADRVGSTIINQVVRETRSGVNVDVANSALNTNQGSVVIETSSGSTTMAVSGGDLQLLDDGGVSVVLNPESHEISRFYLTQLTTAVSMAMKYEVDVTYQVRGGTETRTYNGLAILRQSYE